MTLTLIEEGLSEEEQLAQQRNPTVKCSWCGEIIRMDGAEFVGTFALVFAGTGAIVINDVSGGVVSQVGIALSFGLIVLAMIYALGEISGAHLNPAVTIGFFAAQRFPMRLLP